MKNRSLFTVLCVLFLICQCLASNTTNTAPSNPSLLDRLNANLNPVPQRILKHLKTTDECTLYMSTSTVPNSGRGIFAGKDFETGDLLSLGPAVPVPLITKFTQLSWYVFSSSKTHSSFIFGPACLFNTMPTNFYNVDQVQEPISIRYSAFDDKHAVNQLQVDTMHFYPYTVSNNKFFVANKAVSRGQELFVNYGDNWLENHGIKPDPTLTDRLFPLKGWADAEKEFAEEVERLPSTTPEERAHKERILSEYKPPSSKNLPGICISDVMVEKSTLPLAGQGLFALRDFKKGELVTISPVLLLDLKMSRALFFQSLLMNYVVASPGRSDYGLFFTHYTSMINHSRTPNLSYRWFDWDEHERKVGRPLKSEKDNFVNFQSMKIKELLALNPSRLLNAPLSNFDLGFYAERDISRGEELFISYGAEWERQFNFFLETNPDCVADILKDPFGRLTQESNCYRQFIHPIEPPVGLFPLHWQRHEV